MGAAAFGVHTLLQAALGSSLALIAAIGVGGVVYFAMLFLLRGISAEDVLLLPKGDALLHLFQKLHLMEE